ncbi:MAG TPA: LLM class flavin-dependent oxidoreductase [Candidatus Binatia bacterium]|nr:LLM class flavin-dependent oxidoreductase [Candidatus Binatia bacterium]
MRYGLFFMPLHPPERAKADAYDYDVESVVLADQLGYHEAWIGEHFTAVWENLPAPDLMIAKLLGLTRNIILGTGVHLLPYHDPMLLAHRVACLDHLARGRFYFGVGSGGLPTDFEMFHINAAEGEQRFRTREALEIILRTWTSDEPFDYQGRFWHATKPAPRTAGTLGFHMKPFQQPHPPIGVAGLTKGSETLVLAGEMGLIPMSVHLATNVVINHWETVEAGARKTGRTPSRKSWRILRDVYVAETDEQARAEALGGIMGRSFREYFLPLFGAFQVLDLLKQDPSMPNEAVTAEYMADQVWAVGSPDTVAKKLRQFYYDVGGFGTVLMVGYDHGQDKAKWRKSLTLFANEVMPQLKDLEPAQ